MSFRKLTCSNGRKGISYLAAEQHGQEEKTAAIMRTAYMESNTAIISAFSNSDIFQERLEGRATIKETTNQEKIEELGNEQ